MALSFCKVGYRPTCSILLKSEPPMDHRGFYETFSIFLNTLSVEHKKIDNSGSAQEFLCISNNSLILKAHSREHILLAQKLFKYMHIKMCAFSNECLFFKNLLEPLKTF